MDFVEDDEPILHGFEKEARLGKPMAVVAVFRSRLERIAGTRYLQRQRRLARLTGADQGYRRLPSQGVFDVTLGHPSNHPCNLSTSWKIYKDIGNCIDAVAAAVESPLQIASVPPNRDNSPRQVEEE